MCARLGVCVCVCTCMRLDITIETILIDNVRNAKQ